MNDFLKVIAGLIIVIMIVITLDKQGKEISILLVLFTCSMVMILAGRYLQPVFALFSNLQRIGKLDSQALSIILKATGIGFLSEITALLCADAGKASLGKSLQVLSAALILWLILPLLNQLLDLIESILGYI